MALPDSPPLGHSPAPMDLPLKLGLARFTHGVSPASVAGAYADWFTHLLVSPSRQADLLADALRKGLLWAQYAPHTWRGDCVRCVEPVPQDKRFSPPEWNMLPFSAMAQAFLLQDQWWTGAMTGVRGVSRHHEDVAAFTTRQWLDMWSPSNFPLTNPQVLKETLTTGGANLAHGFANWSRDAMAVLTEGKPRGVEAFLPGKGVALTPGKVVFRNRLIELIQYEPATAKVDAEPVLIVPSWIMKYYILDLTPADSLVRYLVDQGHSVFMVSWKNPGSQDRDLGLDDYLELGAMAALKAVGELRPGTGIHAAGYCLGGTLLAMAAAALGARPGNPLKTVSLLAAQVDFHEPGELGLFIDESQIAFLEDLMAERGYLDGRQMAGAFALINSKDLVWSKLVHEYLMGAQTPMTALRAWNADATRLPARMHSEYLRRLYLHNDLAEGRYMAGGRAISLADIKVPVFVVATERDHVSPWTSVYKIQRLTRAPVSFVLTSGGHNVGIVNPPSGAAAHPHASYRFATHAEGAAPADPKDWLESSPLVAGSWWPCWHAWLRKQSTRQIKAVPGVAGLPLAGRMEGAPGTYVHQT
ncbi:alpha/beta fold hydrolase [Polaromonas sp.]|uniref:PHA/PHB synthase family protein n=1 Tax=Polaromonas sp. TaxID=1869339 RepID=UPI002486EB04|nr:alpha/beta fold hydrolase [Polaromonas sp.]MDI1272865.1 alpha/beta fold hydrolase [Polaromonas sp.]